MSARLACALALALALATGGAHAADDPLVPMRDWLRDVEKLQTVVLDPLNKQFTGEDCIPVLGYYLSGYLQRLKTLRGELHVKSYLLFREVGLVTAQDVGIYVEGGPPEQTGACRNWDVWSDGVLPHIENKIEFIGNVFALTSWE